MPDVNIPGARQTDVSAMVPVASAGFGQRAMQAARYLISGVTPTTWFGPNQPLQPMAPEGTGGRQFDYATGLNLNYNPRSNEAISFEALRNLADSCDILRIVLEACKEQMAAMDIVIRPRLRSQIGTGKLFYNPKKDIEGEKAITEDQRTRIEIITQFMQRPDNILDWDQWQRALLEDMFVIDAATVYRRYTRGGKLYALELIDGATIKPLIGADGRRPMPPSPAYQQVLHGIPAADFTFEEMLYKPRNVRTNRIYGYSPVEWIIVTVNTAIRRSLSQLDFYLEGTQPDAFVGLPKEWDMQNVKDFQAYFDALLSGMFGKRRKVRFMPGEFKYQETKPPPLKDLYDEWLARIVCFAFSVSPMPFITQANKGASSEDKGRALEEGKAPRIRWMKGFIDTIIAEDFNSPDLEMMYLENVEQDPKTQMEIDIGYVKAGVDTIDEVRSDRGKAPWGGVASTPMIATNTGYVPLDALIGPDGKLLKPTEGTGTNLDGTPLTDKPPGSKDTRNASAPASSTSPTPTSQPAEAGA